MEEQGGLMDVFDLSPIGKKKLTKWIGQQTRKHNNICVSRMIEYAPNEHKLMQMMRYIDKWHDEHPTPQDDSQEATGDAHEDSGEEPPETAPIVKPETPVKPQKEISKKTKGRINEFILNHPGAPISEIVSSAADEAELLRRIEEMESRVVPVDIRVRLWTVRRL